jgi:integrase
MEPHNTRRHVPGLGSIFLRGRTWHCEFWKGGVQHRESTRTSDERKAVKFLKGRAVALDQGKYVGPRAERLTVSDLLDLVTADYVARGNRSGRTLKFRLAPLKDELGHLRAVTLAESNTVETYKTRRLGQGMAKASVNRELAALRRAYRLAVSGKHRLITPAQVPTIEMFPEATARQGFVDYDDLQALVSNLVAPVDDIVRFAFHSGWRRGEIVSLRWADVDRARGVVRLRPESKTARELPITGTIAAVIERRWSARLVNAPEGPKVCDVVFHRDGAPVLDFRGAWAKAAKAIGRPGLLFHDLRRSAVRNMIAAGVPEKVAMTVTGHKTRSVFDRYHIVNSRDVLSALQRTESALTADPLKAAIHAAPAQNGEIPAQTARRVERIAS